MPFNSQSFPVYDEIYNYMYVTIYIETCLVLNILQVRARAQSVLAEVLHIFPYSYKHILSRTLSLLKDDPDISHEQLKVCFESANEDNQVFGLLSD